MALKMNGEVPFPQAGEGIFFRFGLRDLAKLEEIYGVGESVSTIEKNLLEGSGSTMIHCIETGLKRRNADGKAVAAGIDVDEIEFSVRDAFEPIMDALFLALTNQTYAETIEEAMRRRDELEAAARQAESAAGEDPLAEPGE